MKKLIVFLIVLSAIFAVSCNNQSVQKQDIKTDTIKKISKAKVEIMYFHGTNRCATCNAVESNAQETLIKHFKSQLTDGTIAFNSYDFDADYNKEIVEKYQIGTSTLLIVRNSTEKPILTDFTETAFKYAKNSPEKYIELLKEEISKQLTVIN